MTARLQSAILAIEGRLTFPLCAVLLFVPGLLAMLLLPPGSYVADQWAHAYRVSGILNGDIVAHPVDSLSTYHCVPGEAWGGRVSDDLIALSLEGDRAKDGSIVIAETVLQGDGGASEVPYNNTAVYSPLAYLPQLAGMGLGSLMGLAARGSFYLAELAMLCTWALLGAAALRLLPRHRLAMLVFLLFPLCWFPYSYAISADSFSLILAVFFSCLLFRCAVRRPSDRECLLLAGAAFLLAFSKLAYAPLICTMLMLPLLHRRLHGRWILLAGFIAAIALELAWMKTAAAGFATSPAMVPYDEVARRTAGLLAQPFDAVGHILYSIAHLEGTYRFGTQAVAAFWAVMLLALGLLVWRRIALERCGRDAGAHGRETKGALATWWFWAVVWIAILGCALAAYLALYLQYNPAANPGVEGVQYRYFLPLLPSLILLVLESPGTARKDATSGFGAEDGRNREFLESKRLRRMGFRNRFR